MIIIKASVYKFASKFARWRNWHRASAAVCKAKNAHFEGEFPGELLPLIILLVAVVVSVVAVVVVGVLAVVVGAVVVNVVPALSTKHAHTHRRRYELMLQLRQTACQAMSQSAASILVPGGRSLRPVKNRGWEFS